MNELMVLEDTSHENILKVYELLYNDDFFFIVTELAEEGDLHNYLTKYLEKASMYQTIE